MGRTLYVAAGGGGDAVAAWALGRSRDDEPPIIATLSWDRLSVDPLPGPRSVADFRQLRRIDDLNYQVLASSEPISPAGSTLPRLAGELDSTLLLLDPCQGATGLRHQFDNLVATLDCEAIEIVDVGGDILAKGDEDELLSPLADCLILAATQGTPAECRVTVLGAGLDGELPAETVRAYVKELDGYTSVGICVNAVHNVMGVLDWFPSEATALLMGALLGERGIAQVRDAGRHVALDDESTLANTVTLSAALAHNELADALKRTTALEEVEEILRARRGQTEIDYERAKMAARAGSPTRTPRSLLNDVSVALSELSEAGVDRVTYRRLAELTGATTEHVSRLVQALDPEGKTLNGRPLVRA